MKKKIQKPQHDFFIEKHPVSQKKFLFTSFSELKSLKIASLQRFFSENTQNKEIPIEILEKDLFFEISLEKPCEISVFRKENYEQISEENPDKIPQISAFLNEELEFLLKNCEKLDKNHMKKTILPLPSSRFFLSEGLLDRRGQNPEFDLLMNFFCEFLEEEVSVFAKFVKEAEKRLCSF